MHRHGRTRDGLLPRADDDVADFEFGGGGAQRQGQKDADCYKKSQHGDDLPELVKVAAEDSVEPAGRKANGSWAGGLPTCQAPGRPAIVG